MNIGGIIVIFVTLWWLVLFMTLPFGIEQEAAPEDGHDHGAPKKSGIKQKMLVTTVITVVLVAGYVWLQHMGYLDALSFRPQD